MLDLLYFIAEQSALYLPLVLGAYISIALMRLPNLSIEAAFVTGAVVAQVVLRGAPAAPQGLLLVVVCGASLLGGLMVGLVKALLMQCAATSSLLASILATGIFYGINLYVLDGAIVSLSAHTNPLVFGHMTEHSELYTLLGVALVVGLVCFLLFKTQLGYSLAIYGNNPLFFKHYNISSSYVVIVGLMISNALAGLSGYLVAQSSGFVDINAGMGVTLFCITALMLGKLCVRSATVMSAIVPLAGVVLYCLIQQLLLRVGCNIKYFMVIQAFVVLGVILAKNRGKAQPQIDHLGV